MGKSREKKARLKPGLGNDPDFRLRMDSNIRIIAPAA
jgi:hypothetical protein